MHLPERFGGSTSPVSSAGWTSISPTGRSCGCAVLTADVTTTGWSTGMYDFNNDGRKDLFCANGDLNENAEALSGRAARQANRVLVQQANGTFEAVSVGPNARHRGAAFGDFDNDGRVDVVVSRIGEKPLLLRNTSSADKHWLGLKLEWQRSNRDGIGAWVKVRTSLGEQWNQATTTVGYASASDVRVHFGLGEFLRALVEIHWPSGAIQELGEISGDRYVTVREQ